MKLEEKISVLRKQQGWSQEELAFRLDVSRQAVSKWEMGSSLPEVDKILKMSELFDCSTDYLLKDGCKESRCVPVEETEENPKDTIQVCDEDCCAYIQTMKNAAWKIAVGVMLCICSPITLFLLLGAADKGALPDKIAAAIGVPTILVFVVIAVAFFIVGGRKIAAFERFEDVHLSMSNDLRAEMQKKKDEFSTPFTVAITIGVALCILAVIPLIVFGALEKSDEILMYALAAMFFVVSIGVFLFVRFGMVWGTYELFTTQGKIDKSGHFSVTVKNGGDSEDLLSNMYWCLVLGGYLLWSFLSGNWGITWIVWPIAGVLSSAASALIRLIKLKKKKAKGSIQVRDEMQE